MQTGCFVDVTGVDGGFGPKDGHRYDWEDVLPLTASRFEGVKVCVPMNAARILEAECGSRALEMRVFRR